MGNGPAPLSPRALRTRWALAGLKTAARLAPDMDDHDPDRVAAMGLRFPGRIGLAAGVDRHGVLSATAHRLGLGGLEVGTFFGPAQAARGAGRLRAIADGRAVLGVSIGKRPATPWPQAEAEFVAAFLALHRHADYITLNPGRTPPDAARFAHILEAVALVRERVGAAGSPRLPLVAKLPAAWLADGQRVAVCATMIAAGASGLLLSAEGCSSRVAREALDDLSRALGDGICLISVGGIGGVREARARLEAGAQFVQLHRAAAAAPRLIRRIKRSSPR